MANKPSDKQLPDTMDKLSLNDKLSALSDREAFNRYPHRKYAQTSQPSPATAEAAVNDSTQDRKDEAAVSGKEPEDKKDEAAVPAMDPAQRYPHRKHQAQATNAPSAPVAEPASPTPVATTAPPASPAVKKSPAAVADSWEDEANSDTEPSPQSPPSPKPTPANSETQQKPVLPALTTKAVYAPPHRTFLPPAPPPPTPSSPSAHEAREDYTTSHQSLPNRFNTTGRSAATAPDRRPETTTAVANRLIAGALGVRAPRRTPEQREYDKALREQEKKRREQEREARKKADEETARAKAAVWDD